MGVFDGGWCFLVFWFFGWCLGCWVGCGVVAVPNDPKFKSLGPIFNTPL